MLGNNIYDHYWWFYVTWNWFRALISQFFNLRPSKMPCIILSRMSLLCTFIKPPPQILVKNCFPLTIGSLLLLKFFFQLALKCHILILLIFPFWTAFLSFSLPFFISIFLSWNISRGYCVLDPEIRWWTLGVFLGNSIFNFLLFGGGQGLSENV